MRTAKVIALSCGAKKKIFHSGDEVNEGQFYKGDFDKKITEGFLKLIGDDGKPAPSHDDDSEVEVTRDMKPNPQLAPVIQPELKEVPPVDSNMPPLPGGLAVGGTNDSGKSPEPVPSGGGKTESGEPGKTDSDDDGGEGGLTVVEIRETLKQRGIAFPSNAKKADLIKLMAGA